MDYGYGAWSVGENCLDGASTAVSNMKSKLVAYHPCLSVSALSFWEVISLILKQGGRDDDSPHVRWMVHRTRTDVVLLSIQKEEARRASPHVLQGATLFDDSFFENRRASPHVHEFCTVQR